MLVIICLRHISTAIRQVPCIYRRENNSIMMKRCENAPFAQCLHVPSLADINVASELTFYQCNDPQRRNSDQIFFPILGTSPENFGGVDLLIK